MAKDLSGLIKICEAVFKHSIYALVFLLPILFLPWTSDILDFNKQALLVLLVFTALFAWMAKVLLLGKFSINLNKTHIAVLVLFLAYLFSTIFSLDKYGSFWGWPLVTSESLLTLTGFVLLYLLISNVFTKKEIFASITILILSGFIAVLLGALQLFSIFMPFNFAKSTSFNSIGTVGSFGIFFATLLPLLIISEIYVKKWLKIIIVFCIVLVLVSFVLINYVVVWWLVLTGCALLILFSMVKKGLFDLRWLGLPMFFLVLALFFIIIKPQLPVPSRAIEVYLSKTATYDIALKAVKEAPIFGSGPGTFVFDFSKYKKSEFNQGLLWNVRFDKGGSKAFTVLATTGVLGFISLLSLIAILLFYGVKFIFDKGFAIKKDSNDYSALFAAGTLIGSICASFGYFLYNSNLSLDFLFFFLTACFIGLIEGKRKEFSLSRSSSLTLGINFVFTLLFIFGLGLLILDGQRYIADIYYVKGVSEFSAGQRDRGLKNLEKAVGLNPKSDLYLVQLSQAYLSKTADVINQKDLSQEAKNQAVQFLVSNSINASKLATDINPRSVSNWSIRGFVYQNLIGLVPGAEDWALKSYDEAVNLEPMNPYYPTQQGIVYMAKATIVDKNDAGKKSEDLENAKKQFEKAAQLKSDYAPARFQTAMVYQAGGQAEQEVAALEEAKKYSPNDVGLLFQIGLVYYQEGNFSQARSNLESAIAISPDYANALYFLGLAYSKLGQVDKAVAQFQKVSYLNPDNAEVKKIISNLAAGRAALDGITQQNPPQAPVQETPPEKPKK